ncbi:MAG: DNA-formamidopyrimidine glycosylase [Nitrososphaera sp.]|nr:DNA-formamidopyrimidine glycosylase [Nitrososphaera sp.]
MPELPEVETVARELREGSEERGPSVVGKTITKVTIIWPRHIATPSLDVFKQQLGGQTIEAVTRRGKYLVFQLTRDVLLLHLRMSGDLYVRDATADLDPHTHTIFHFHDGYRLCFSDTRKFGRVFLVGQTSQILANLGPEPLEREFTVKKLETMLAAKHRQLKPLLLDQTFIAGLGNIYTDEALHLARLHPLRRSDSLTPQEVRALWRGIRRVLQNALRHKTVRLRVYERLGKPCLTCGTLIGRIVVGQRGTYFCSGCQKLHSSEKS